MTSQSSPPEPVPPAASAGGRHAIHWIALTAAFLLACEAVLYFLSDDSRRDGLGFTLIVHQRRTIALWTPGDYLLEADPRSWFDPLCVACGIYLLAWTLHTLGRWLNSGKRKTRGFPID